MPQPRPTSDHPTPEGRRRSVRAELLRAAMDLFAKGGSRGTPLAAIAERIGVTTPAITHHFGTKRALLLEIVDELDRADFAEAADDPDVDWEANIRAWARSLAGDPAYANLSRLRAVMVTEALDVDFPAHHHFVERQRRQRRLTADALARAQRDGTVRGDADVAAAAAELVAFLQGVQLQWLLDPDEVRLIEIVDAFIDRLVASLIPARSR